MAHTGRLKALAKQLQSPAASVAAGQPADEPFPALSGAVLPPWHASGGLPAGLRLRATKGVGTNTRENRRMDGAKMDNMQPMHGRNIYTIELVDVRLCELHQRVTNPSSPPCQSLISRPCAALLIADVCHPATA